MRGFLNLFRTLGLLDGTPSSTPAPHTLQRLVPVRASRGRLLEQRVALGDRVCEGQVLTTITSITGEQVEEVRSPCDGLLLRITTFPTVSSGEQVVQLGLPA